MTDVLIRGAGVASSCCAQLLRQPGIRLKIEAVDRPTQPAIMLSETTQKLVQDIFGREGLFAGLPRISTRIVSWSQNTEPLVLPHSAVVVSERVLLDRIQPQSPDEAFAGSAPDWAIVAAQPLLTSSQEHQFGSRIATASHVRFRPGADTHACWIESCARGWLFLLPGADGGGWLLSVGDLAESLLAESRLIGKQIAEADDGGASFPSHPRITDPLCGVGWLACGTAALGFDPLCGDGAGHAVREAILASAVVRAASAGGDVNTLVMHYRAPPSIAIDGSIVPWLRYNLGWRRDQIGFDNADLLNPANSFNRWQGINSPKATLAFVPPESLLLPSVSVSFGQTFFTNDPRIGTGLAAASEDVLTGALRTAWKPRIDKNAKTSRKNHVTEHSGVPDEKRGKRRP